jgi:hypothetical protein
MSRIVFSGPRRTALVLLLLAPVSARPQGTRAGIAVLPVGPGRLR